jgi:predicted AAA+ superfamily ATPase
MIGKLQANERELFRTRLGDLINPNHELALLANTIDWKYFEKAFKELAEMIAVSRKSLLNYLTFLEKAQLLNLLQQDVSGLRTLSKPEKIYLNNTNIIYALENEKPNMRNIRETFLFNQLKTVGKVTTANKANFTLDDKYIFEVGGKNKGHEQIAGMENAYLALDNLEYGFANKIPLWLFGMFY